MQATETNKSAPAQFVFMPLATGNTVNKYNQRQSKVNGALQILAGILAITANTVDLCFWTRYYNGPSISGYGFICGGMFIFAGLFGILAGRGRTKCRIVVFMVFSILASLASAVAFFLGIGNVYIARDDMRGLCQYHVVREECLVTQHRSITTGSCMIILATFEAGFSIWGSALCCKAICCGAPEQVAGVLYRKNCETGELVPCNYPEQIQMLPVSSPEQHQTKNNQDPLCEKSQSPTMISQGFDTHPNNIIPNNDDFDRCNRHDSMEKPLITA